MSAAVKAPAELNIYSVAQVRGELLAALGAGAPVDFDASGVVDIDGAGVQLLVSVSRTGGTVARIIGMPDAVRERCAALGIDGLFRDSGVHGGAS